MKKEGIAQVKSYKYDLHVHSLYSYDCNIKIDDIINTAKKRGLSGIAFTDHDNFLAYNEILKHSIKNFIIIPGIEIKTDKGDIIGLFLKHDINIKSRDFLEVVKTIRNQNGIVVYPHPYRGTRDEEFVASQVDLIEILNGKSNFLKNLKSYFLARKYKKVMIAGSDAHTLTNIGIHGIILECENNLESIKNKLLKGNFKCFGFKEIIKINISLFYKKFKKNR